MAVLTTYYLLLATCLLPTTYYLLPTTYYLLPTTYHLLPTIYYLLFAAYYLLLPQLLLTWQPHHNHLPLVSELGHRLQDDLVLLARPG